MDAGGQWLPPGAPGSNWVANRRQRHRRPAPQPGQRRRRVAARQALDSAGRSRTARPSRSDPSRSRSLRGPAIRSARRTATANRPWSHRHTVPAPRRSRGRAAAATGPRQRADRRPVGRRPAGPAAGQRTSRGWRPAAPARGLHSLVRARRPRVRVVKTVRYPHTGPERTHSLTSARSSTWGPPAACARPGSRSASSRPAASAPHSAWHWNAPSTSSSRAAPSPTASRGLAERRLPDTEILPVPDVADRCRAAAADRAGRRTARVGQRPGRDRGGAPRHHRRAHLGRQRGRDPGPADRTGLRPAGHPPGDDVHRRRRGHRPAVRQLLRDHRGRRDRLCHRPVAGAGDRR